MTAYSDCPSGQGIVARNVYDGSVSAFLQGAYTIFDAPAGNTVDNISFEFGRPAGLHLERGHGRRLAALARVRDAQHMEGPDGQRVDSLLYALPPGELSDDGRC